MAYIDKINPEIPEGRILIRDGIIILKDESATPSLVSLPNKWQNLIQYIVSKGYSSGEISKMKEAYGLIERFSAFRDINMYNKLRKRHPKLKNQLMWWLLFDYYDIYPSNRKVSPSAYDSLTTKFRKLLDDCMRVAKDSGLRDLTISVEASMTANFLCYLQDEGLKDIHQLEESTLRKFSRFKGTEPEHLHRIGIFLGRYAEKTDDGPLKDICLLFPGERSFKKVYQPLTEEERVAFEEFLFDENCELSKRDRAICIMAYLTGIRKEDIEDMKLSNIDWDNDRISFTMRKTGEPLILPLRPVVGNAIYDYIRFERPKDAGNRLFVSFKKFKGEYTKVNASYVVNNAFDLCGIRWGNVRRGTHLLRHNLADRLINQGSDLAAVSETLGHRDPNITEGYLSANIEQLRQCALDVSVFPITHNLYTNGTDIH